MKALRENQQQEFSRWLWSQGYPNIDVFTGQRIGPHINQQANLNIRTTNNQTQLAPSQQTGNDDSDGGEASRWTGLVDLAAQQGINRQYLEDMHEMIETVDQSGVDVLPADRNDTHAIVREDGTLDRDDSRKKLCCDVQ